MFTTHIEVRARLHIISSLSLLKGKIVSASEQRMGLPYKEPMEGIHDILKASLQRRLQHFLEPGHENILNREPSQHSILQAK